MIMKTATTITRSKFGLVDITVVMYAMISDKDWE